MLRITHASIVKMASLSSDSLPAALARFQPCVPTEQEGQQNHRYDS